MSADDARTRGTTAAVRTVRAARRRSVVDVVVGLPAWASVLTIWAAGRVLSGFWLALAWPLIGRAQPANAIRGNDHGFLAFLTSWDGQYYQDISLHGYPSTLPMDAAGHVAQNAWAFLPAFPFTIRMLTASTGVSFELGAPLVALAAGLVATYLLHALLRERAGARGALWAVFFFTFGPLSFLLQVGYAESMFLAIVFGALLAMRRRRYVLLTALGVLAAFTRPGALAIPLTLGVLALIRWVRFRRAAGLAVLPFRRPGGSDRLADVAVGPARGRLALAGFPVSERIAVVLSGLAMALAGVAWPLIAAHVTGDPDAYLRTEMSWWVNFIGRVDFVPLTPWFLNAGRWLGFGGIVIVIGLLVGYTVWLCRRSTRRIGAVPLTFSAAYALYVFAVSIPMASTPRLLVPLTPLFASEELTDRPWKRWTAVGFVLVAQPVCVAVLWLIGPP